LAARLLATEALWVRIQTSTKWATSAKEWPTHSSLPKKICFNKNKNKIKNSGTWPGVGGERVLASMRRGAAPFNFSSSIRVGGRLLQIKVIPIGELNNNGGMKPKAPHLRERLTMFVKNGGYGQGCGAALFLEARSGSGSPLE
jgi:hypothetical protein